MTVCLIVTISGSVMHTLNFRNCYRVRLGFQGDSSLPYHTAFNFALTLPLTAIQLTRYVLVLHKKHEQIAHLDWHYFWVWDVIMWLHFGTLVCFNPALRKEFLPSFATTTRQPPANMIPFRDFSHPNRNIDIRRMIFGPRAQDFYPTVNERIEERVVEGSVGQTTAETTA
ncbi:unnamed protein product, partial [Mesorhabditis spiculigera]